MKSPQTIVILLDEESRRREAGFRRRKALIFSRKVCNDIYVPAFVVAEEEEKLKAERPNKITIKSSEIVLFFFLINKKAYNI